MKTSATLPVIRLMVGKSNHDVLLYFYLFKGCFMDSEIQSNFTYDNSDRNEASVCYEMCQGAAYVGLKVNAAPDEIKHVSQVKEKVDRKQILIAKMLC